MRVFDDWWDGTGRYHVAQKPTRQNEIGGNLVEFVDEKHFVRRKALDCVRCVIVVVRSHTPVSNGTLIV